MQDFVSFFLLLVVITIFYVHLENKSLNVVYQKFQNQTYLVRNTKDKDRAAEYLYELNHLFTNLINYCDKKLGEKNNFSEQRKEDIIRLKKNYNSNYISESSPGNKHTSYSINKGEKIVFCLRDKKTNELIPLNTIKFVGIHELAHLMTKSIGHHPEFWENMKFLLKIAIDNKWYVEQDFMNSPVSYCGTVITDTPLSKNEIIQELNS